MRTVVIVVFVLVAATPAYASKSCMTMAEARQQFSTTHLYWHGSARCWDDAAPDRPRPLTSTSTFATPSSEPTSAPSDAVRISYPLTPETTLYPELMPGSTSRDMLNIDPQMAAVDRH